MEQTQQTSKARLNVPQVIIIDKSEDDAEELRPFYEAALPGTQISLTRDFPFLRGFANTTYIDFVVLNISWRTSEKQARQQIGTISRVCPEAKIILMADEGFNPHHASVKAIIQKYPPDALKREILGPK